MFLIFLLHLIIFCLEVGYFDWLERSLFRLVVEMRASNVPVPPHDLGKGSAGKNEKSDAFLSFVSLSVFSFSFSVFLDMQFFFLIFVCHFLAFCFVFFLFDLAISKQLLDKYADADETTKKKLNYEQLKDFKASEGWFEKFATRFNIITSRKLQGLTSFHFIIRFCPIFPSVFVFAG